MIEKNIISKDLVPSYFLESLIYNISDREFKQSSYVDLTYQVMNKLAEASDENNLSSFMCQNRQIDLFGSTDQQWNINDCKTFITNLVDFWNEG
jgi:hypothetical protein